MASLPARRPSQRRASPPEQLQTTSPQSQAPASPIRSRSEDSQTIFVHNSDQEQEEVQAEIGENRPPPVVDDPDVKKCWICMADSTEDTPETSPWRDPCPCALVAHEECLLDWIADTEGPKTSRNQGISAPKIECPQCKHEIKLARPKDYAVDMVRALERLGAKAVTPTTLTGLVALLHNVSVSVGMHSVYAVFGADDGYRILRPILFDYTRPPAEVYVGSARELFSYVSGVILNKVVHWRLYAGLPLITPILVLSRTSLADGILPALPIVFFASQAHSAGDELEFPRFPPSAGFSFAMLPYVRGLYNFYYQKVWAEHEKRWLKEIEPRTTQAQNDGVEGNANGNAPREEDGDDIFEVRINGGLLDNWEEDPALEDAAPPQLEDEAAPAPDVQDNRPIPGGGGNEQAVPIQDGAQPQQNLNGAQNNAQAPAAPAGNAPGERRLSFAPMLIAEKVIGALLFPTIAGLSGELLKLVLPRSWTTAPPVPSRWYTAKLDGKGFLQQKWARSLVGGCLFVVGKDALMLYVRWKMAKMHRERRVVDYNRKKGRASA